jgi:hypothetical protein
MPAIFDTLYREYCRVRLAEMRKRLLIRPESHEVPEANCDASRPDCAADRGDSQREAGHPQAKLNGPAARLSCGVRRTANS